MSQHCTLQWMGTCSGCRWCDVELEEEELSVVMEGGLEGRHWRLGSL
jgi:hypothetical protein